MGGMQRVSLQLVETLKKNPNVVIETIKLEAEWGNIGLATTRFLLKNLVELPGRVELFKPDVVLFSSMVTASLAPLIRQKINVPMVTINHGQDVTTPVGVYQWYVPKVFKALDGVISVSRATRQACIDRGMDPEKGIAIPNGFSPEDFNIGICDKIYSRKQFGELLGLDVSNKKLLLTTGRLVKRKGHAWFIRNVLPKLNVNTIYVILGDGPEREDINRSIVESKSEDRVIMLGRQSDEVLKLAYCASDLFVMPNIIVPGDMEGFGVVMLEANLMGTPVVASDLEGIKDVVNDGKNGYKIPVGDFNSFSLTINNLLSSDFQILSESSKVYVFENFTWEKVAMRYTDYLSQVAETRKMANLNG
jgi:phosphatidylinositol alpha-1,6-mannosyltransferase